MSSISSVKKIWCKEIFHMTDGTYFNGVTIFQQASCKPFITKCTSGYICSSPGSRSSGFFPLWSPLWVPTRCYLQALISMGWCHHFWQDICWDHIISSYLSRLFTPSFKLFVSPSCYLSFTLQELKYCDSVISNSSLHFPQWFFLNNIVQNP